MDSTVAETSGFIVQITDILALPDKEGCSILVNLEFRNGTWSLVHILISQVREELVGEECTFCPERHYRPRSKSRFPVSVSFVGVKVDTVSGGLVSRICGGRRD